MTLNPTSGRNDLHKPLRLWPGITLALLLLLVRFGLPRVAPGAVTIAILGGLFLGILFFIWWAFFSRAPRFERWGGILLIAIAMTITSFLLDASIATGAQGMMFILYSIPIICLAFIVWAIITRKMASRVRRISMVLTILVAVGGWVLLRNDGITGDFNPMLAWRWSPTPEERSLEQGALAQVNPGAGPVVPAETPLWPGFRGPDRDNAIPGTAIATDWDLRGPQELWRTPIGPGCSSFTVSGNWLYTQEQRGEEEAVTCYSLETGQLAWIHTYEARFWDSHAGAGPRSTPALSGNHLCTLGATGILTMLDARDGTLAWSHDILKETGHSHSGWGCSSSPVITDSVVIVAAIGQLLAYDLQTGALLWKGPDGGDSYSSPQLATIGGIPQVMLMAANGLTSISPADGSKLWEYSWPGESRIVQPAVTDRGDMLICSSDGMSLRCVNIRHEDGDWRFEDKWTTTQMKPNFNDLVVHGDCAYGYTGNALVCIEMATGERSWRGKRYGGQILLLCDQDLLLVLSEQGEVALVEASAEAFRELSILEAIEGKTWNHPVLAGDVLLVRNTEEMAAFRLPATEI